MFAIFLSGGFSLLTAAVWIASTIPPFWHKTACWPSLCLTMRWGIRCYAPIINGHEIKCHSHHISWHCTCNLHTKYQSSHTCTCIYTCTCTCSWITLNQKKMNTKINKVTTHVYNDVDTEKLIGSSLDQIIIIINIAGSFLSWIRRSWKW